MPREDWGYPEFPMMFAYLWDWFLRLNRSRQSGMGISGISNQEIKAFCELRNIRMSVFELDAIEQLDEIAMNSTKDN